MQPETPEISTDDETGKFQTITLRYTALFLFLQILIDLSLIVLLMLLLFPLHNQVYLIKLCDSFCIHVLTSTVTHSVDCVALGAMMYMYTVYNLRVYVLLYVRLFLLLLLIF